MTKVIPKMTPERWQQVKDIFDRAVERSPASRISFIRECCCGDDELRKEVESLLASDTETGSLLENPLIGQATVASPPDRPAPSPADDDSFGLYVPVRVLGEGGMGTVYLARQQRPIRREVALKVVKRGMDSRQVLERFEIERQALALMDYPNVARVLDAGTSQRGRPYFVMEFVDGVPITQYCDRQALSTRERLQLFIPVCNALQHAHKKGIIHRDVKPSNILVTEVDGKPVPKVIDFGIARATDQRSAESEAFTLAGQIIGTPEYMSPEQASLDNRDIDTGTDVYSLGMVLYELLVGSLPLDMKALRKIAFAEVLRAIRETPVPKPTARITQMGADAEGMAQHRSTNAGQLRRDLSGDLDSIVMKAIDKDRHCRYGSASDFAADIERFLKSEPVLAGPPGAAYQMRKFVVRHKRPVAAAAAVVLALVAGIIATTLEARRAVAAEVRAQQERNSALEQQRRADNEAAIATAVNDFLRNDLLSQASPNSQARPDIKPDPDLRVRTALDRAAARITGKFDARPLVEASIRLTIGSTYSDLGQYSEAQRELARSLDLRRRVLGEDHPDTLAAMYALGSLYFDQRKHAEAEAFLNQVLEVRRRVLGEEHPDTLAAMGSLARLYRRQGKYAQGETLLTKELGVRRRLLGENHLETLGAMGDLAYFCQVQGKYAQAERLATETLQVERRVLGDEHPATLASMIALAYLYQVQGKFTQAEPLYVKGLELSRRVLGGGHPSTLVAVNGLGDLYQQQSKYGQAEQLLTRGLEVSRTKFGPDDATTTDMKATLGAVWLYQRKYVDAEALLRESMRDYPKLPDGWQRYRVQSWLGGSLAGQRKYAEAESLLLSGYRGMAQRVGATPAELEHAGDRIVKLYLDWGKPEQAAEWQAKLKSRPLL
jgi:non-specific serine/threonine protein kinase/serine/threonine-protein kinase